MDFDELAELRHLEHAEEEDAYCPRCECWGCECEEEN